MKLINTSKEKRINAILYFCKNTRRLSETKLYKLIYFLDFLHFKEAGRPVTDLEYFAWNFGPVPTKLFFEIKNKKAPKSILNCLIEERDSATQEKKAIFFKSLQDPDLKVFSPRERKILENVAFIFREATAKDMTEITHLKNEPWDRTLKSKGEKKKIDWFLALDAEATIDRELAEERLHQSEEMKELFGNG